MLSCGRSTAEHFKGVLKTTQPAEFVHAYIYPVSKVLTMNSALVFIPEDLLADHRVTYMLRLLFIETLPQLPILIVDPNAFRSSRNFTIRFQIEGFDTSQLSFSFLSDFNVLESVVIKQSSGVGLSDFPSLPNLQYLTINQCSGLNEWVLFPTTILSNTLEIINLKNNGLNNEVTDRILEWILNSCSDKNALKGIFLDENALTRIPRGLKYFPTPWALHLSKQKEPGFGVLTNLDLRQQYPSRLRVYLTESHITRIEPDTFQG